MTEKPAMRLFLREPAEAREVRRCLRHPGTELETDPHAIKDSGLRCPVDNAIVEVWETFDRVKKIRTGLADSDEGAHTRRVGYRAA